MTIPPAGGPGLRRLATAIRLRAVAMVAPQGFGYLGQALSAAEQYAAVYGAAYRRGTDRVVCSPGHYVIAAYAAAAADRPWPSEPQVYSGTGLRSVPMASRDDPFCP